MFFHRFKRKTNRRTAKNKEKYKQRKQKSLCVQETYICKIWSNDIEKVK